MPGKVAGWADPHYSSEETEGKSQKETFLEGTGEYNAGDRQVIRVADSWQKA